MPKPMTAPVQPVVERRTPLWRSRRLWLSVLFVVALAWIGLYVAVSFSDADRLRSAIDEADRIDPGWRMQDLESARKPIADDQNSALVLIHSIPLLPKRWPSFLYPQNQTLHSREECDRMNSLLSEEAPPEEPLPAATAAALRLEMQAARTCLDESRQMLKLNRGRNPLSYTKDWYDANLSASQKLRWIAQAFRLEALLQIQENDLDGALDSARAIAHTARAIGDEPFLVSMYIRVMIRRTALRTIERTLAQGELKPTTLAALQEFWQEESEAPLYLTGMRGTRAKSFALITAVKNRSISLHELQWQLELWEISKWSKQYAALVEFYYLPSLQMHLQAAVLEFQNRQVEVAKLASEEQPKHWPALAAKEQQLPWIAQAFTQGSVRTAEVFMAQLAQVRCMIATLAAERFRQARGCWPAEMKEMIPEFLPTPLLDPFTAKPLIMHRTADGLIIYSVSTDGEDDGGNLAPNYRARGSDIGMRLWDPDKRRQPAKQLEANQ